MTCMFKNPYPDLSVDEFLKNKKLFLTPEHEMMYHRKISSDALADSFLGPHHDELSSFTHLTWPHACIISPPYSLQVPCQICLNPNRQTWLIVLLIICELPVCEWTGLLFYLSVDHTKIIPLCLKGVVSNAVFFNVCSFSVSTRAAGDAVSWWRS